MKSFLLYFTAHREFLRVFVNGRSRPVIMKNMRSRIDRGDVKTEEKEAIKVNCSVFFRPSRSRLTVVGHV